MGILWVILSWGVIFWIWSLQGKARMRQQEAMRRSHLEYIQRTILESFGKMLAFIAKADGHISKGEVDVASRCLRAMGLSESEYQQCVAAFNSIHDASFSSFMACAEGFAHVATSEACTLLYEMLWIVAAADGVLEPGEDNLLRSVASPLGIDTLLYHYFKRRYFGDGTSHADGRSQQEQELEKAYAKLGCTSSDTDEALKTAYRKLAMRYHPDRLRAEGVPEGMISQATRSMAEINGAWETIKHARGL